MALLKKKKKEKMRKNLDHFNISHAKSLRDILKIYLYFQKYV